MISDIKKAKERIKRPFCAKVTAVLKAEKPWAPSGVAVRSGNVYVLEHINPNSETHEAWPPRVRKLEPNGKISTVVTITK